MKYALITGGTRGIGLKCCEKFSKEGYAVTATWSQDERSARSAMETLPAVRFVRADVSDEEAVKALLCGLPALDVLINNAGISCFGQVQDVTWEDFMRVTAVNAGGPFLLCKHAVPKFLKREQGAIVNVASIWGETGGSCESAYSASKGALIAFTKALAKELAPSRITVNCVSPGVIDTAMNARLNAEERAALCEEIPLGRFGRAEEVAEAIFFLSHQTYITGQVLSVNGGMNL